MTTWVDPGTDDVVSTALEQLSALDERHIKTARRGFIAMILLASLLIAPWVFCVASGVILTVVVLKTPPAISRRSERARLLVDCHAQHAALMAGGREDTVAFFGNHPPTPMDGSFLWCAPPDAYPSRSRVA